MPYTEGGINARTARTTRTARTQAGQAGRDETIHILIGYGYHPTTTGAYLQRAFERRATVTFVGTPWGAKPGYDASGDLGPIVRNLPAPPDLYLHVDSGSAWYFPRGVTDLECPTACYLIDVHVQPRIQLLRAMFFDYAFVAQRDFVPVLRAAGHPQVHWLPLACDPAIHRRHDTPTRYDVGFVGATGYPYTRRSALLARLARRYSMNDYTRSYAPEEMARVYSESRLVFNCSLRHEINMRVFEAPATGTPLLTDRVGNGLDELMTDREHLVTYDDASLLDVVDELLRDDALRERIGCQGYEHVRACHTYDHRAQTVLDVVFAPDGARMLAPWRQRSAPEVAIAYAEMFSRARRVDDTVAQLKSMPARWRYRLPAAWQVARCLVRRAKDG